jgi:uroporphyrinogen-III decarboxylase
VTDEGWSDASNAHIPIEWLTIDADEVNRFCADSDRFVLAGACPRPFEQLQFIRGTENLNIDLMDCPKGLLTFMATMHNFYCDLMTKWAKTDVDALTFMDDWGSQRSLLINPSIWVDVFKPMYKDYSEIAHSHNKKLFMHSDGYILDIIPHLIEVGVDALNSQIFCMTPEALSPFAGKVTFWGEIDRQNLLPHGTINEIADAVSAVHDNLWCNGGCIAQCEFGPGARPENVEAVFRTWDEII